MMKDLVEKMAKALVDRPEEVNVAEVDGEKTTVFELRVAPTDLGKVIGKQGKTARAMRTILSASGTKIGKRCVLAILESIKNTPYAGCIHIPPFIKMKGVEGKIIFLIPLTY